MNEQTKIPPLATPNLGSAKLLSVEDARQRVVAGIGMVGPERIALAQAHGRVASEDVLAHVAHPPMPVSAMDGYALRSDDAGQTPVRLRKIGASRAGARFVGVLEPGTCVRIFTGGMVPEGADLIALQEDATEQDGVVEIREIPRKGQHIRRAGLDFVAGQVCVERGRSLTARDIGLLASGGHTHVAVRKRPRVAILSTGDELVAPGGALGHDQIVNANGVALAAAVAGWGAEPLDLGIAADRPDAIAAAVDRARDADILVTTGGASVGEHDLVQAGVALRGFVPDFWRIAMRPGKPLMFGRIGELPVLSMPGNPVSALVCSLLFLRPALRAMQGLTPTAPVFERAKLGSAMPANDKREDYVRARLAFDSDRRLTVTPFPTQDSSMLMTLAQADALIRRAPFAEPAQPGDDVDVLRLDGMTASF